MTALPFLFQTIIAHDALRPDVRSSVVSLGDWREWRTYKNALNRAAQDFIKRQRGDGAKK